jgi:hypothetical protein
MVEDGCTWDQGCSYTPGQDYADYVYTAIHTDTERQKNSATAQAVLDGIMLAGSVIAEPLDWMSSGEQCLSGECSAWMLLGLLPFVPTSAANKIDDVVDVVKNLDGVEVKVDDALDLATDFLGKGYREVNKSRFLSADGLRQVRMDYADLLGLHAGGPHINFDILKPNLTKLGSFTQAVPPIHIFLLGN